MSPSPASCPRPSPPAVQIPAASEPQSFICRMGLQRGRGRVGMDSDKVQGFGVSLGGDDEMFQNRPRW